jgi:CBS domain-containing protein
MQAKDIMTTKVITIGVGATIKDAVAAMLGNSISGLPVLDDAGAVVGIISEGDLLHRVEGGTERKRTWWLRLLSSPREEAEDFITAHSHMVADVMNTPVLSVGPDTDLREIATILEERRIKRVPVIDEGNLVGIVSRANMLQALASGPGGDTPTPSMDDRALREAITKLLVGKDWASHGALNVIVSNGSVELWGLVDSEAERKALCIAAAEVPGVTEVVDHLGSIQPWLKGT